MLPGGAGRRMPSRGILGRTETSSPGGSTHSSSSHPSHRPAIVRRTRRSQRGGVKHDFTTGPLICGSPRPPRPAQDTRTLRRRSIVLGGAEVVHEQRRRPHRTTGVPRTAPPGRAEPPRPARPAFPRASSLPRLRGRRHRQDARPRRRCLYSRCRGLRACPARRLGHALQITPHPRTFNRLADRLSVLSGTE